MALVSTAATDQDPGSAAGGHPVFGLCHAMVAAGAFAMGSRRPTGGAPGRCAADGAFADPGPGSVLIEEEFESAAQTVRCLDVGRFLHPGTQPAFELGAAETLATALQMLVYGGTVRARDLAIEVLEKPRHDGLACPVLFRHLLLAVRRCKRPASGCGCHSATLCAVAPYVEIQSGCQVPGKLLGGAVAVLMPGIAIGDHLIVPIEPPDYHVAGMLKQAPTSLKSATLVGVDRPQ